jgi:hypothetical protein
MVHRNISQGKIDAIKIIWLHHFSLISRICSILRDLCFLWLFNHAQRRIYIKWRPL